MRRAIPSIVAAGAWVVQFGVPAGAAECPEALANSLRLALVTTSDMRTTVAQIRRYVRASTSAPWVQEGASEPAVVGTAGLGWGATFDSFRFGSEPLKVEGDRRTPAGVFSLRASFGFAPSALAGHVLLQPGKSLCVDDPSSLHYNSIQTRVVAGAGTSGEEMWRIPVYRSGIFINYPTDRARRRGSCVFVHIWRSPTNGTAGCIALPEARVKALQSFSSSGAAIAILPVRSLARFQGCLPTITASASEGSTRTVTDRKLPENSAPTGTVHSPR